MKARNALLSLWWGVTETILWLPVPVFAASWGLKIPAFRVFLALLPLCYAIGERVTVRWSRMRRIARFGIAAAAGIVVGFALRPYGIGSLTAAVVAAAAVFRGMSPVAPDERRHRDMLVPALILHFIGSIAAGFMDILSPHRLLLAAGGIMALLLAIRRMNRIALAEANLEQSGAHVPRSVVVRNRMLVAAFTAFTLFIAFFRHLESMWHRFIDLLNRLIEWLTRGASRQVPQEMPQEEPVDPMAGFPVPEGEPGRFWLLMEKIAIGIAVIALIGMAILLLRQLLRLPALARLIARWLAAWRERTRAADTGGYVDEVERLSGETMLSGAIRRLKSLGRRESWSAMTPEEQIRWLYRRRFMRAEKRGFRYRPSLTPRENFEALREIQGEYREADDRLREVYTEVRYGEQPADRGKAERLKSDLGL